MHFLIMDNIGIQIVRQIERDLSILESVHFPEGSIYHDLLNESVRFLRLILSIYESDEKK